MIDGNKDKKKEKTQNNCIVKIPDVSIPNVEIPLITSDKTNKKNNIAEKIKEKIEYFSPYDITDTVADVFFELPEIRDSFLASFDNFESGCDRYDYAIAAFSGIASGIIDMLLVKSPQDSVIGEKIDAVVDNAVIKFANFVYISDKNSCKKPTSVASAIGYLERRFKVNYDARYPGDLIGNEDLSGFNALNHHIRGLAHYPSLIGMFFSILDQITQETSVINNGRIVRLKSSSGAVYLVGNNIISKILCAIINWFGHLMSDVAGSSGTRGHIGKRGMGIPIPGFELLQFSGKNKNKEICNLADLAENMFLNGYDFRYGIAMSLPVLINDMITKFFWVIRERYEFAESWSNIIYKMQKNKRLLRMKFVSSGCFMTVDAGDALIRSKGNLLVFALHINYVGFVKFAFDGYKEIAIRLGETSSEYIDSMLDNEWKNVFTDNDNECLYTEL